MTHRKGSEPTLAVGALARRSGLSVSAIHFYEREGLIHAERTAANHRRFPRSTLRRLAVLRVGQRAGIPLAEIRAAFDTAGRRGALTQADWETISAGWRDALGRRIALLQRLESRLTGCIGCGCLSMERCALLNPDDRAASLGPGAPVLEGRLDVPDAEPGRAPPA